MKNKIIRLTEQDLKKIVEKVLNEQGSMFGTAGADIPGYRKDDVRGQGLSKVVTPKKENINPKNLKLGDGGSKNPKQIEDVKKLQQRLMDLGHLVITKPTGYFGSLTQKALDNYYNSSKGITPKPNKEKIKGEPEKSKFSKQVQNQLNYMQKNGILKNESFTILDDINSIVYAFTPGYKLYKQYYVLTGEKKGDMLKTQTMKDWIAENWKQVGGYIWKQIKGVGSWRDVLNIPDKVADYVDGCYFNQSQWLIKNTPSGVFKRAGNIENFMNDLLATTFVAEDYGDRFITWQTCEGKTIPFGFHGTLNPNRLKVLETANPEKVSCSRRNMTFGCINFNANDVNNINSFIKSGQISIWLPDSTTDIVEIPQNCL